MLYRFTAKALCNLRVSVVVVTCIPITTEGTDNTEVAQKNPKQVISAADFRDNNLARTSLDLLRLIFRWTVGAFKLRCGWN